jgi:hypothetical protein
MNNFNPKLYIAINPDLRNLNPTQAYQHYLNHGIKEDRLTDIKQIYPDFRSDIYLILNPDLVKFKFSDIDVQIHWLSKGRYENRIYKSKLDKEYIYLYSDSSNKERCEAFSKILNYYNIKTVITDTCNILSNYLHILFTINHIQQFPFYYTLYLSNYNINNAVLDSSIAICNNVGIKQDILGNNIDKLFMISDDIENQEFTYKRLLFGLNYLDMHIFDLELTNNSINIITSTENTNNFNKFVSQSVMPSINIVNGLKNINDLVGNDITIKYIIDNAKRQNLPYVVIANTNIIFNKLFNESYSKIIKFLNKNNDWDILTTGKSNIDDVLEIIQLDKNIELRRVNKFNNLNFCIYNKCIYDNIINSNTNSLINYLCNQQINILIVDNIISIKKI